jgi:hypothetical protein
MGVYHSSDINAYTYIETQDYNFSPGARVKGLVEILVEKPTSMGQMDILLTCISESKWRGEEHNPKNVCRDKRTLSKTYFRVLSMKTSFLKATLRFHSIFNYHTALFHHSTTSLCTATVR